MDNKVFEQKLKESDRQLVESALMSIIEEYHNLAEETGNQDCKRIVERYHEILRRMQIKRPLYTMDYEELHNNVFNTLNSTRTISEDKFCELVNREHRYLQGKLFKMVRCLVKNWHDCYEQKRYDERNQFACRTSFQWIDNE